MSSYLREAKEALDRGDTDGAVGFCELGLESTSIQPPTKYNLLLIQAAAHKQSRSWPDCEQSLQMAIKVQPGQPTAWQGMLQVADELAEHASDKKERERWRGKREECLMQLVRVAVEPKKSEFLERLARLYSSSDRYLEAAELYKETNVDKYILYLREYEEYTIRTTVEKAKFRLGADPMPILTAKTTAQVYLDSPLLTELVNDQERFDRLYLVCTNLSSEESASKLKELINKVSNPTASLLAKDLQDAPLSNDGPLNQLLSKANAQRTVESVKCAMERIEFIESSFFVVLTNSRAFLKRIEGLVLVNNPDTRCEGIKILESVDNDNAQVKSALLDAYEAEEMFEEAVKICDDLVRRCRLQCKLGQYDRVKSQLESIVLDHQGRCLLGIAEWHLTNYETAFEHFIASAQLNPSYSEPFSWLGKYYSEHAENEEERAERCFKKALSLNSNDREAAIGLSRLLLARHQYMDVVSLLEPVLEGTSTVAGILKDAWRMLGVAYFYLKAFQKASHCLHLCLRGASVEPRILLLLGHAYFYEGKWKAAARAFEAVINSNNGNVYTAKIALARTKCRLNEFDAAIEILEGLNAGPEYYGEGIKAELLYCLHRACRHALFYYYSVSKAQRYIDKYSSLNIQDPDSQSEYEYLRSITVDEGTTRQISNNSAEHFSSSHRSKQFARLAHSCLQNGEIESAKDYARMACRLSPSVEHDVLFAVVLSRCGDYELAERHYSRALGNALASNQQQLAAKIYTNLGYLYADCGRLEWARMAFEKARLVSPETAGEALHGLQSKEWTLMADTAQSLFVHHQAVVNTLRDTVDIEKTILELKPIVDRLAGRLIEYGGIKKIIDDYINPDCSASGPVSQLAKCRMSASNPDQLMEHIERHPFDLYAYMKLMTDSDDRIHAFIGSKLRLLEERYDPREGTMRRHFEEVDMFTKVSQWWHSNRQSNNQVLQ